MLTADDTAVNPDHEVAGSAIEARLSKIATACQRIRCAPAPIAGFRRTCAYDLPNDRVVAKEAVPSTQLKFHTIKISWHQPSLPEATKDGCAAGEEACVTSVTVIMLFQFSDLPRWLKAMKVSTSIGRSCKALLKPSGWFIPARLTLTEVLISCNTPLVH